MATKPRRTMTIIHRWDEVPEFESEAEESAFWASHELDDVLLGQMTSDADQVLPPPRPRTKPIALRFDEDTIRRAKTLASRRGKGYQTLLKEFVSERLYEEEKREGLIGAGLGEALAPNTSRPERRHVPSPDRALRESQVRRASTVRDLKGPTSTRTSTGRSQTGRHEAVWSGPTSTSNPRLTSTNTNYQDPAGGPPNNC